MKILIAEDDSILADGLVRSLRQSAYAVDHVKNGVEADTALSMQTFDLLILDLGLPRMSGLEFLSAAGRLGVNTGRTLIAASVACGTLTGTGGDAATCAGCTGADAVACPPPADKAFIASGKEVLAYGFKKMPAPKVLAMFGERWAPHRSAAAWYLWRAVDLHRAGQLPPPVQALKLPRLPRKRRKAAKKAPRKVKRVAASSARRRP